MIAQILIGSAQGNHCAHAANTATLGYNHTFISFLAAVFLGQSATNLSVRTDAQDVLGE